MNNTLDNQQSVLATRLNLGGETYAFFSIIANLGAVQDVTIGDYKVELMFPNDEKTTQLFKK
ncbi:MAG: hypothetical protein AB8B80_11895 [Marinicellaceae bacterium]